MRKTFALLLALTLLCACFPALAEIDLTYVRENTRYFTMDVNTDEDVAFITANLSVEDRSFVHKYESDTRYSFTEFDLLAIDYSKPSIYIVPRLWIYYAADEYLMIDSVSFNIDGTRYTFTDVGSADRRTRDDNGCIEKLLIKFSNENLDFLVALANYIKPFDTYDKLKSNAKITMTLHGREDVTVDLTGDFFLDFKVVITGAFLEVDGFSTIDQVIATPMTQQRVMTLNP